MANFPSLLAQDEYGVLAQGLVGQVYDVDDVMLTSPLNIFSKTGAAFPGNQLTSGPNGVLPEFSCPGFTVVRWVSGPFRMDIPCVDQVPVGGTQGQVLAKASGNNYDLIWVDPPTGGGGGGFEVDLRDYLAPNRVLGVTDDLPAFRSALAASSFGPVNVKVPVGEYWVSDAVLLPSYSELSGMGMDFSSIRLLPTASNNTWVVSNADPTTGNTNIRVKGLTLDWNYSDNRPGAGGGTRSSCIAFRNVQYGWIEECHLTRAGQHGVDISSGALDYPYTGDGSAEPLDPSRYIWIRNNVVDDWADDGITVHHSEHVWVEDNVCSSPRKRANCNGIEVDDGARYVKLARNYSEYCYSGVEIKAHADSNAAWATTIDGHVSFNDVRSYNFRHIGHHEGVDPVSKSAFGIVCNNLVSLFPNNDLGYQADATPRSLVISAYQQVTINGLISIGRGNYAAGTVAVSVQYRASLVALNDLNISGWTGADQDVSITTTGKVSINGLNVRESADRAIYSGASVGRLTVEGALATGPTGTPSIAAGFDIWSSKNVNLISGDFTGYGKAVRADSQDWATVDLYQRRVLPAPTGVTRLVDLDPTRNYYFTTAQWGTMTDVPANSAGGNFVLHSAVTQDTVVQTVTRNTHTTSLQASAWRVVNYSTKAAGPFNVAGTGGGSAAVDYSTLPAGMNFTVDWDAAAGAYKPRPTTRTDLVGIFRGPVMPTFGGTGAVAGVDEWKNKTP